MNKATCTRCRRRRVPSLELFFAATETTEGRLAKLCHPCSVRFLAFIDVRVAERPTDKRNPRCPSLYRNTVRCELPAGHRGDCAASGGTTWKWDA